MIDWVLSKVWIAITVLILVMVVIGAYVLIYNNESNSILIQTATNIGQSLDYISDLQSNITELIVYSHSQSGIVVPKEITKYSYPFTAVTTPYLINITNGTVILSWQNELATYRLGQNIHPWNLSAVLGNGFIYTNTTILKKEDAQHSYFDVYSGNDIMIVRVEMSVNGRITYETFVYPVLTT